MKTTMLRRYLPYLIAIFCSGLPGLKAASITNNDTGGSLTSGGAWLGGVAPGSSDIAVFDANILSANPAFGTNVLGGNTGWGGIQILNPAVPIQISSGSTLTNGASGIDMSAATANLTVNSSVTLGANQVWAVTNGRTLAVNAVISGTAGVTLNGNGNTNGTIIMNGANTYTGGTLIRGGTITLLNTATSLGAAAGGVTNVGGTLFFGNGAAGFTIPNPLTFSNVTFIDNNVSNLATGNNTLTLPMVGSGTIIITNLIGPIIDDTASIETLTLGAGSAASQVMSGFSGKIIVATLTSAGTLSGGNLRFNGAGTANQPINTGSPTASFDLGGGYVALTVRNGGTVNLGELKGGPYCSLYSSRSTANSATVWSIGGLNTSTTYSGQVRNFNGTGAAGSFTSLTKVGTGILTLSGTNTYTGITTINGGYLNAGIAETGSYGPFGEPTTAVGSIRFGGGGIQFSSVNQNDYSGRFDDGTLGNQAFSFDLNGQSVTLSSALAGTGSSLTITNSTGSGTLTLTAAATYTGGTVINRGKLVVGGGASLPTGSSVTIGAGGTLDVSSQSSPYLLAGGLAASGTGSTVGTTAANLVAAPGGIFDLGTNTVSLTWGGSSTGTDSTHPVLTVSQGTLKFNGNPVTFIVPGLALPPGVYTLATATAITGTPSATPDYTGGNGLAFGCTGILSVSGGNTLILTVAQTSTVASWNNSIGDSLWSTATNWTTLSAPHLVGDVAVFGSAAGISMTLDVAETVGGIAFTNPHSYIISGANTVTLDNNNAGAGIFVTDGTSNKISSAISLNDNTKFNVNAGKSLDIAGTIANTGGAKTLEFKGGGTNILETANTYGTSAGTIGSILSGGTTLQVGNSGSIGSGDLRVVGGTLKSGAPSLSLANNILVDPANTLTVNNNSNTFTLGGVISGSTANLVVAGGGALAINAVETYGGTTTVNAGTTLTVGGQLNSGTYSQTIVDNGIFGYNGSGAQTLSGIISGSGIFTKNGSGNLTLSAANTYSGGSQLSGGVVQLLNAASLGTGNITNSGSALLLLPGTAMTFANNLWFTGTSIIDQNSYAGSDIFNGTVGGNGTVIISNLVQTSGTAFSTLTFGGAMTNFTGKINIAPVNSVGGATAGFLRFDSGTAVVNTGSAAASFNLGASPSTAILCTRNPETANLGELTGGPGTALEGPRSTQGLTIWSIGGLNTSTTFSGVIENADPTENPAGLFAGLTKVGTGTLTLAGVNTYTGPTTISNGTLALITGPNGDSTISSSTNIFINTNATLKVNSLAAPTLTLGGNGPGQFLGGGGNVLGSVYLTGGTQFLPGGSIAAGTFTVNGNLTEAGVTNQFYLPTIGGTNATNDLIQVNGNLDISSGVQAIVLNGFNGGSVSNGTYPLFSYTGTLTGDTNNLAIQQVGTFPYIATLVNNTGAKQIAVVITSARATTNLVWKGDGGNNFFDSVSPNDWQSGGTPFTFESGDKVVFTDSGAPNTNVTIQGIGLYPASVLVSNSAAVPYNFLDGGGSIAGTIGIIKTNSGTVTINNNNSYTGQTVFGGGTVAIPTLSFGGTPSPIGAANNNATNLVFAGGTLAYIGSDTATDRGLTVTNSGGTINVVNGTTLTINGLIAGTNAGNATLTKTGLGTLVLGAASSFTANIVVNGGTLSDTNAQNSLNPTVGGFGNPQTAGRSITVNNTGILSLDAAGGNDFGNGSTTVALSITNNAGGLVQVTKGNATLGPLTLNGGTLDAVTGSGGSGQYGPFAFSGTVTVGGTTPSTISSSSSYAINLAVNGVVNRIFNVADATGNTNPDLIVSAALGDSSNLGIAGLIKTGAGTMALTAANTYSGPTIISNGVLRLTDSGGIGPGTNQSTSVVNILGGTLAGSGTVSGPVTNGFGGTIAPGNGTNVAGTTLALANNLTMLPGSTTIMQIKHGLTDQININGPVIYNGILIVSTNAGDATPYQVGNTFSLFNANGGFSGSFATIQPPPGPGLGWNQTGSGSIIVVSAPTPVVASFTGSPLNGPAALPVTFVNNSTGATYYDWTFGDGSVLSTNATVNINHTYNTAGTYTVILKAYGVSGTSSVTNTGYVVVTNLPPVPSFTGTPTNGTAPLAVTFTNTTTGVATSWLWSFGDGTTFTAGASTNVTHTFTNAGSYNVGLTATGTGGVVGITNVAYITATNIVPVAQFSGTPTNLFVSQSVVFTNTSTGNSLTNWVWSFGNGTTITNLTGVNVTNAYAAAGTYSVSLTVIGPGGSSTTNRVNYITVYGAPSIGSAALIGTNLVVSGTGGAPGAQYRILTTANLTNSVSTWTPVRTNTYDSSGNFSYTNSVLTNSQSFFRLVSP